MPEDTQCSDIKHWSFGLRERDGHLIKLDSYNDVILQDLDPLRIYSLLSPWNVQSQRQPHPRCYEHLLFSLKSEGVDKLSTLNHSPQSITNELILLSCLHYAEEFVATAHRELMYLCEFRSSKVCLQSILSIKFLWLHPHCCFYHLQLHAAHWELPKWKIKLWQFNLGREVTTTLSHEYVGWKCISCSRTDVQLLIIGTWFPCILPSCLLLWLYASE